jgi:hypothetical protein
MAAGADRELVGMIVEVKDIERIIAPYFPLHLVGILLLDTRVLKGPVAESLVSTAALGHYILHVLVRSVDGRWSAGALFLPSRRPRHSIDVFFLSCPVLPPPLRRDIRPSERHGYGLGLTRGQLNPASVAPSGPDAGTDKPPLRPRPSLSLGQSLRNLLKTGKVRKAAACGTLARTPLMSPVWGALTDLL